jgi:hypothetical protein
MVSSTPRMRFARAVRSALSSVARIRLIQSSVCTIASAGTSSPSMSSIVYSPDRSLGNARRRPCDSHRMPSMWAPIFGHWPDVFPNSAHVTTDMSGSANPARRMPTRAAAGLSFDSQTSTHVSPSAVHWIGVWPRYSPVRCATTRIPSMPTMIDHFPPICTA